jgi:hypothetical protein
MIESSTAQTKPSLLRTHATGLGVFSLLALLWLRPLPLHLTSRLPGEHDIWLFLWNFWWVKKALLELAASPYWTDWAFYPAGVSLFFHALTPLNSILAIPMGSGVFAYNLLFIASFALAGYAAYLVAHRVTGDAAAAIVAGYIYAFSPFHWSHLHHLEHLSIQWTAFWVLALMRRDERPTRGRAALAGLAFAIVFYANVYLGLFAALLGAMWLVRDFFRSRGGGDPAFSLRNWIWVAIVGGLLTAPVILGMAAESGDAGNFKVPFWIKTAQSLDVLAFVTPSWRNPLLNRWHPLMFLYEHFTAGESTGYLGLSVIALAAFGALRHTDRRRRFFVILAAAFVVLSLGPLLHVAGTSNFAGLTVPLPQALLQNLPAIGAARVPARYLSVAMLFIALLAGMGWQALHLAGRQRWAFLLAALVIAEYAVGPVETTAPRRPDYCAMIAKDPDDVAVMDLPLRVARDPREWWRAVDPANDLGWLQTLHGKRSLTGPISHTALHRRNFRFFLDSLALAPLVSETDSRGAWPARDAARDEIRRLRIRYFVLHRGTYARMASGAYDRDREYLETYLGFACLTENREVSVLGSRDAPETFAQVVK